MIDRRNFLAGVAAGGALAATHPAFGSLARVAEGAQNPQSDVRPFELEEATIADLQQRMEKGQESARSLVEKYLARIDALDRLGPELRQVLETNPDAIAIAEALDKERKGKGPRGPLHGIPVLVKDNVGTADRMSTTAGSLALEGSRPARDAFIAKRLRDAGAVLLGKTNMSEWANFRSTHSSSGWSARGGQGRNPYALDRNTSGSSSGSAAGVAASYCTVAVGTETDGSIVSPSNNNSIVGLKPTLGLVSRSGIIPIAHSQDTAGPMARTVTDAAVLLGALVGADPNDAITRTRASKGTADYRKFLDANGLKGKRVGVARKGLFGHSVAADALAEQAVADIKRLGAVVIDPADIPHMGELDDAELDVLLYEFKADLNKYLAQLPAGGAATLEDLIAFNDRNKDRELRYFGQELFIRAQKKGPLTSPDYRRALEKCRQLSRTLGLDAVMSKHRLDALVAPTGSPPSLTDLANGDYGFSGASTFPAVAGYPHITVPAGYHFGLPVGLSFIGRAFSEPTLVAMAFAYEQATRHRRPPQFLATAALS
ncbi:MAG: amidase [Bacteroidales bacterium]